MKGITLLVLICICGCFSSCGFVIEEQVIGKYHIVAVDANEETSLSYKLEDGNYIAIVPERVLAYCRNEEYIFLKQTPYGLLDTLNINYYIVPILKDNSAVFPEDSVIGPLNEQKFNEEISKLSVRNLKFEKLY